MNKYQITGKEYEKFNVTLKEIGQYLKNNGFERSDLMFVDEFLYFIVTRKPEAEPMKMSDFDHDEIRDKLVQIGLWLGFEALYEHKIAKGAKVDVVWKAKIANLGTVAYVFEVHKI